MIIVVLLLNFAIYWMTQKKIEDKTLKFTFGVFNVAFFCYSCVGIFTYRLDYTYYISYLFGAVALNFGFGFGNKIYNRRYEVSKNDYLSRMGSINETLTKKNDVVGLLAFIYIAIRIINLVYPTNYLPYLFQAPTFVYDDMLLELSREAGSSTFNHLLSTLKTVLLPFMLIYLSQKPLKNVIAYYIFDIICVYMMGMGFIGRLSIIQPIITVCLFCYFKAVTKREKRIARIVFVAGCCVSLMVYAFVSSARATGQAEFGSVNLIESIKSFANSEFFYPRNYELASVLHEEGAYQNWKFWWWLITLPIPKIGFAMPGVDSTTSIIYRVFSYNYFGGHWYYEAGVGGMLISVLGDGIMMYGKWLAFIPIIPFGMFIGFFMSYLNKIKGGTLLMIATLFYFVVSFRPGLQYGFTRINVFVAMSVILFVLKHTKIDLPKIKLK